MHSEVLLVLIKPPGILGVQYIGACSVQREDIMNTLEVVQYIGGIYDVCGGYHEYITVFNINKGFYELAPPHES